MRAVAWLLLVLACSGCAQAPDGDALDEALSFLATQRTQDAFDPLLAPYVAEAAWAAGLNPAAWPADHPVLGDVVVPPDGDLLDALRPSWALALADADGPAQRRQRILDAFDGKQFGDPRLLNDDAYAILALRADGEPAESLAVQSAADHLLEHRAGGSLWSHGIGGRGSVDSTGMAVLALAAAGRLEDVPADLLHAVAASQQGDGFAETADGQANCDSTVWALRTYALLGAATPSAAWQFLEDLRRADGGVAYLPGQASNALCTSEAATLWGLRESGRLTQAFV